jgi:hypothetical protein
MSCKGLRQPIKAADIFGYKVNHNFNKKGDVHSTCFGGCLSLAFVAAVVLLAVDRFVFMGMQAPVISEYVTPREADDAEATFGDSATLLFFQVKYTTTGLPVAVKDVTPVLQLTSNTYTVNKTKKASEPEFVKISDSTPVVECTREKFEKSGIVKLYDDEFKEFGVHSFMCVDMSKIKVKDNDKEQVMTNIAVKDCEGSACNVFFSAKKAFYK